MRSGSAQALHRPESVQKERTFPRNVSRYSMRGS